MRAAVFVLLLGATLAQGALAGSVVATRTIRAQSVISPDDVALADDTLPGAVSDLRNAVGLETRVTVYAGHPLRAGDLSPPAVVERNQSVRLVFQRAALTIQIEGRALDRGAVGDAIRVMNTSSKATVVAVIGEDGGVYVHSQ